MMKISLLEILTTLISSLLAAPIVSDFGQTREGELVRKQTILCELRWSNHLQHDAN